MSLNELVIRLWDDFTGKKMAPLAYEKILSADKMTPSAYEMNLLTDNSAPLAYEESLLTDKRAMNNPMTQSPNHPMTQ